MSIIPAFTPWPFTGVPAVRSCRLWRCRFLFIVPAVAGFSCASKPRPAATKSRPATAPVAAATLPASRAYTPPIPGPASLPATVQTTVAPQTPVQSPTASSIDEAPPDLATARSVYVDGLRLLMGSGRSRNVQEGMKLIGAAARNGDHHAIAVMASLPYELSRRSRIAIVPTIRSAEDARELEDSLKEDSLDVGGRIQLLHYYRRRRGELMSETPAGKNAAKEEELAEKCRQHQLWMIENCPDAPFMPSPWDQSLGFSDGGIPDLTAGGESPMKAAWLRQIELHPADPRVLTNAATFFDRVDRQLAWDLTQKVSELRDPAVRLQHLKEHRAWIERREALPRLIAQERARVARELLESSERIIRITDGTRDRAEWAERADMYRVAGMSSLELGFFDRAKRYGDILLDERFKPERETFPLADHYGHVILGRIALHNNDIKAAKEQLLKAEEALPAYWYTDAWSKRREGEYPIHPDVSLARGLLEAGAREEVLHYLERCADVAFPAPVKGWVQQLKQGKKPDFSEGLDY